MTQGENINPCPRKKTQKEGKSPIKEREKAKKERKFPIKRGRESRKKKKGKKIPDQGLKENRRNMQKGLLDQTTSEQIQSYYQVNKKKEKKERKPRPKVALSL